MSFCVYGADNQSKRFKNNVICRKKMKCYFFHCAGVKVLKHCDTSGLEIFIQKPSFCLVLSFF